jgi:cellulose synthase/poly-beta-1,6-N-acetylglucosamine synthase-like glycosyltransferase
MVSLIISLLILFAAACLLIAYKLNKIFSAREKDSSSALYRKFSIVIAAQNEEKNIAGLIGSLSGIDYPLQNIEIIIVDDNSSDGTYNLAVNFAEPYSQIKVLKINEKKLPGKKGVLSFGISNAQNEYILITDADCRPESKWIKKYSCRFSDGFDFLFGIAPFITDESLINKISSFENLRSSLISFAAASIGGPYSASARNLGFRKSSFTALSGYSNVQETLSGDDDLLLREAVKNKMKIGVVPFDGSKVYSFTKSNFRDYVKQKSRHIKTSFHYLPVHKVILSFWHLINIFFLLSPLLFNVNTLFLLLFFVKISFDLILVLTFQKRFGYKFHLVEIIYLQVIYELFLVVNFLGALLKKDVWH